MTQELIARQRGSLHGTYVLPSERRDKRSKFPRLLECVLCIAQENDPQYLAPPAEGEFVVVDTATSEKAWLEIPPGATPEVLTGLIEGRFAARALQVAPLVWVV